MLLAWLSFYFFRVKRQTLSTQVRNPTVLNPGETNVPIYTTPTVLRNYDYFSEGQDLNRDFLAPPPYRGHRLPSYDEANAEPPSYEDSITFKQLNVSRLQQESHDTNEMYFSKTAIK